MGNIMNNNKNNSLLTLLVAFIVTISVVFGQTYNYPSRFSGYDVAEWNMRGGHIASGTFSPTSVASEGALFYDISTPSVPILYRYSSSGWSLAGGSGGESASLSIELEEHIADQIDPHGATMTVSQSVTIGSGTPDAFVEYNGTGTVLISSYTQFPFETTGPETISSDAITLWADPASDTLRLHDGSEWLDVPAAVKSGVFAYLTTASDTNITVVDTWYPIQGVFDNEVSKNFTATDTPAIIYNGLKDKYFEIDWHTSVSASDAGVTVHCAIKKNGVEVTSSMMGTYFKNINEAYAFSGTTVVELSEGDTIQLVVKSDTATTATFNHYTTTIRPFFY